MLGWCETQEDADKIVATIPVKRLGTPEAVARACLYLAESADYSTGAELTVDGGRLIAQAATGLRLGQQAVTGFQLGAEHGV